MISDVHPKLLVKSIEFAACNFTNFFFCLCCATVGLPTTSWSCFSTARRCKTLDGAMVREVLSPLQPGKCLTSFFFGGRWRHPVWGEKFIEKKEHGSSNGLFWGEVFLSQLGTWDTGGEKNNNELHILGVVWRPPHVCLGYPSARSSASEDEQADEVQCPISLNTANGHVPDFELRSPKTTPILLL